MVGQTQSGKKFRNGWAVQCCGQGRHDRSAMDGVHLSIKKRELLRQPSKVRNQADLSINDFQPLHKGVVSIRIVFTALAPFVTIGNSENGDAPPRTRTIAEFIVKRGAVSWQSILITHWSLPATSMPLPAFLRSSLAYRSRRKRETGFSQGKPGFFLIQPMRSRYWLPVLSAHP